MFIYQRVCHFRFHVIEKPVGVEDSKPQRFPRSYFWAPPNKKDTHVIYLQYVVCFSYTDTGHGYVQLKIG